MNKTLKGALITINILGIIGIAIWYIKEKGTEPIVSFVFAIAALLGLIFTKTNEKNTPEISMKQKGGKKSKLYQSGGDMTINK